MKQLSGWLLMLLGMAAWGSESITDDFSGAAWGSWKPVEVKAVFAKNPAEGKNAPGALQISFEAENTSKSFAVFLKSFPAELGAQYQAEVFFKCANFNKAGRISLSAQAMNEQDIFISVIKSTTLDDVENEKWKKVVLNFEIPQNGALKATKFVRILISAQNCGKSEVIFDDFMLKKIDLSKEYTDAFDSEKWDVWKGGSAKGEFFHNRQVGRNAPGALQIKTDGNPLNQSLSFLKRFPVNPGKTYTFLVYAKGENLAPDAKIFLSTQGQDSKFIFLGTGVQGSSIKGEDCASDWKRLFFTFKVPESGKWQNCGNLLLTLGLINNSSGSLYLDDFEFFEEETEE